MTADEKEARDLKRAMMSDDFPEGPDGDLESRKIFVGELLGYTEGKELLTWLVQRCRSDQILA